MYKKIRVFGSNILFIILLFSISIVFSSCANVSPSKTIAFQNSVNAVDVGMKSQLDLLSKQIVDGQLERVLNYNRLSDEDTRILIDADFPEVLSTNTKVSLMNQISILNTYAELLRKISDKTYKGQFTDAVAKLNAQINEGIDTVNDLGTPQIEGGKLSSADTISDIKENLGTISSIIATIGEFAIDRYAQKKTLEIIKKSNDQIVDYCNNLQILIHPNENLSSSSGNVGLISLTELTFRQVRNGYATRFESNSPPSDDDLNKRKAYLNEQRELAGLYEQNLSNERSQILILGSLRVAIGKIGEAHTALATEDDLNFWTSIDQASEYLELAILSLKLQEIEEKSK